MIKAARPRHAVGAIARECGEKPVLMVKGLGETTTEGGLLDAFSTFGQVACMCHTATLSVAC